MPSTINRQWARKTISIANGGTTGDLDVRGFAGGGIQLPSSITGTALAWHVSCDGDASSPTWTALYDEEGTVVPSLVVAASRSYQIPTAAFGFGWVRVVMDAQGAARTIKANLSG